MLVVGDNQYEIAPEILALLREVIRRHPKAAGHMSLVEDKLKPVVKTPKPRPKKAAKKAPPRPGQLDSPDAPEAHSEQAPPGLPHLEVLKLARLRPEHRTGSGSEKLLASLVVRGDIWALMTRPQREWAMLTFCLAHRVKVPKDGGEATISKAALPIQTHPYVVEIAGAWWEGMDPESALPGGGDAAEALAGPLDDEPLRRAEDLSDDALA